MKSPRVELDAPAPTDESMGIRDAKLRERGLSAYALRNELKEWGVTVTRPRLFGMSCANLSPPVTPTNMVDAAMTKRRMAATPKGMPLKATPSPVLTRYAGDR